MFYSDEFLEQLKQACPIESVAGDYVTLKRKGRNLACACPFHSEKTPSCYIFPETNSFYCFGCGAGGDVLTWVQMAENEEFTESVKRLAARAGLELPENDNRADRRANLRSRILQMNREAANFYYKNLVSGPDKRGLLYFAERKLKPETIKKYGLGFAPDNWTVLMDYLHSKGYTEEEMEAADLAHRSRSGKLLDTFRNRVMFPIVDVKGNVIGFGGRVLDDSKPKYLNTSDTLVFDKGNNLFSLNFAKDSSTTQMILAEGYMDVIAVNQAGFSNVVATLGTAITPNQARKIKHYASSVIIAYDSDGAGQNATKKAINRFSEVGLTSKILHMTGAKDPDEYIKKFGKDRFRLLLEQAGDAINFRLEQCAEGIDVHSEAGKTQFLKKVVQILADIENDLEREVYLSKCANTWEFSHEVLQMQVENTRRARYRQAQAQGWKDTVTQTIRPTRGEQFDANNRKAYKAEEIVLRYLLSDQTDGTDVFQAVSAEQFQNPAYQKAYSYLKNAAEKGESWSFSYLGNFLTREEMAGIAKLLANEIPVTDQEAMDCVAVINRQQIQVKKPQSDEDLRSIIEQKRKRT